MNGEVPTNRLIQRPLSQVLLRIYHQPFFSSQSFLEHGVAGGEGYAVVSTFYDELDGGDHLAHLGEAGSVVAEEVGTDEGVQLGKTGPRDEGTHCEWARLEMPLLSVHGQR